LRKDMEENQKNAHVIDYFFNEIKRKIGWLREYGFEL